MLTKKQLIGGLVGVVLGCFLAYQTFSNAYRIEPTYRALTKETSKLSHDEYGIVSDFFHSIDFKTLDLETKRTLLEKIEYYKWKYNEINNVEITEVERDFLDSLKNEEYKNGFMNIGLDVEDFSGFKALGVNLKHVPSEKDAIFIFREWSEIIKESYER